MPFLALVATLFLRDGLRLAEASARFSCARGGGSAQNVLCVLLCMSVHAWMQKSARVVAKKCTHGCTTLLAKGILPLGSAVWRAGLCGVACCADRKLRCRGDGFSAPESLLMAYGCGVCLQSPDGRHASGLNGLLDGAGEIAEEVDAGEFLETVDAYGVGGDFLIYTLKRVDFILTMLHPKTDS